MIDNNLAAESAAKFVVAKLSTGSSSSPGTPVKESSAFKSMKDGLNKPVGSSLANMLDSTSGVLNKKANQPFNASKQVGRNQTFGADVNRAGVPRRTGG